MFHISCVILILLVQGEYKSECQAKIDKMMQEDEVDKHNLTHLPYRNWCPICVRAKGKDADHRRVVDGTRCLPEYSFDYAFPGTSSGTNSRCW